MQEIDNWLFLILGLLGGLVTSYVFWWVLNHRYVPNIVFSPEVARSEVEFHPSGFRYQVAVKNIGKREAFNVRFRLRMRIKDVRHTGGTIFDYINLELVNNEFFMFAAGSMFRITPLPHKTARFSTDVFPEGIQKKYRDGVLGMDDLFNEWAGAEMFLEVIATDRFSGGMKFFRSPLYTKKDIRRGVFKGKIHDCIHKQTRTIGTKP
ncbi:hypothetical protein [Tateyamaria sp. syn59]|uniref:hypothetical protein n=1 Tax=Tateyamaria sp. syn59 TaxID=2576942 RepID=UPI0011BE371C|nr:hypothetical protein [Tateyamaria sp. syn59]